MPNMLNQTIYKNGRYKVLPLVTLLVIEVEGRRLQTFDVGDIEQAVGEVDRLAEQEGSRVHCTM